MNARSQVFEIAVEARQVEEAVASIFHAILFHRSMGKFTFPSNDRYVIGNVGYEDIDCDFIDHTYVRTKSSCLNKTLQQQIANYSHDLGLKNNVGSDLSNLSVENDGMQSSGVGSISLEFYQKRRRWPPFWGLEEIPWEMWTVRTEVVHFTREHDRHRWKERAGEILSDKIMHVGEIVNRHDYVPNEPKKEDLGLIFDTSYPDIQPYLFKISFTSSKSVGTTIQSVMQRFI